jgi:hypothetical protein
MLTSLAQYAFGVTRSSALSEQNDVKATWQIGDEARPQLVHHVTMCHPRSKPCNGQCPWLVNNHGTTVELYYDHQVPGVPMPEIPFSFAPWKRTLVWEGDLRDGLDGYGSLCHVRLQGTRRKPGDTWDVVAHQCSGALVMQQREVLRHVERGESALTAQGAARVAGDMLGREVAERELADLAISVLLAHAHPSLLDPRIGSDAVAPPLSEHEMQEWARSRPSAGRSRREP